MSLDKDLLQLTLLDRHVHRREAFVCGEPSLERYLKHQAGQDAKRDGARPYVLVDPKEPEEIVGYFTLSALSVALDWLPADVKRKLSHYPEVPAILIGRLAVAKGFQGQGCGRELLRRALRRCDEISSEGAAASLIVVDALHAPAADFYIKYGFQPFDDNPAYPRRLFIPMGTVRRAVFDG